MSAGHGSGFVIQKFSSWERNPTTNSQELITRWSPPLYYRVERVGAGASVGAHTHVSLGILKCSCLF